MPGKFIVHVSDRDDPKRGEVIPLEDRGEVERLLESLLETGFEQGRIRVFTGDELDIVVTQRPVVTLVGERAEAPIAVAESLAQEPPDEADSSVGAATFTPFVQNGVRFSSQFRRDGDFVSQEV